MKKCAVLLSCFFVFALNAQKFPAQDLFYTVPFNIPERTAWWHEGLEMPQLTVFMQTILNAVDSGRIDVYVPEFPYSKKMDRKVVQQLLHHIDTIDNPYGYLMGGEEIYLARTDLLPRNIFSISFHEEWQYDGKTKTFFKKVKGIILNGSAKGDDRPMGAPLFYIRFNNNIVENGSIISHPLIVNGLTHDLHTRDHYIVLPAEKLFRDDISMQGKMQGETKKIIGTMLTGKKIIFYDTLYPYNKPLSKKTAAKNLPQYQAANAIRFFEDWIVDLEKMTFIKKVRGIVLENETEYEWKDYTGTPLKLISFKRLAFLPLNGYVPAPVVPFDQKVISGYVSRQLFFCSPLLYETPTIHTDSARLMKMCIGICDLVESQKLAAYGYAQYGEPIPLTTERRAQLFAEAHEANIPVENYTTRSYDSLPYYYQVTSGMLFRENWSYNSTAQTFEKQVDSITLLRVQHVLHLEGYFPLPLFTADLPPVKDAAAIMKPEFLVAKNIQSPVIINYFYTPQKADAIAYNSDMAYTPHGYYSESLMESSVRYNFIQQIINDALAGKTTVYDGKRSNTVLSPIQFRSKLDAIEADTVNADLPSDYLKFQKIIFVEDWYFNPATGEFHKKVNEIVFVNSTGYLNAEEMYIENDERIFSVKLK